MLKSFGNDDAQKVVGHMNFDYEVETLQSFDKFHVLLMEEAGPREI